MSKGNNLQSLFCGILFCISVTALIISCLAFTKKGGGKGEYYEELGPPRGTGPCGVLAWDGAQACSPPRNCRDKEGNPACCCKNRPHSSNPFCTWARVQLRRRVDPGPRARWTPTRRRVGWATPACACARETGTDDNGNSTCHCTGAQNHGQPCTWGAYSCP